MTDDKTKVDQSVKDYNDDISEALHNSLTGLKRPKITLADMAELAAGNDNKAKGVKKHG